MTTPDSSPQHGYRRPATFTELPLVTVLAAAAVVLAIGLRGDSAGWESRSAMAQDGAGGADQVLSAADSQVERSVDAAVGADWLALAPVGPVASRSGLDGASDCGAEAATAAAGSEGTVDPTQRSQGAGPSVPAGRLVGLEGLREGGTYHRGVRHGEWITLHGNGSVRERGAYSEGLRDGLWQTFSTVGALMMEEEYLSGGKHGDWRMYARSGDLIGEGNYETNLRSGRWTLWYSDGSIKERGRYEAGLREGTWEFFDDLGRSTLRSGLYRAGIRIN